MLKGSKNILAKLLATENITVIQGNYPTASFNVQSRTLKIPTWDELSVDDALADMLLGHEVGHALYTPHDEWVDVLKQKPPIVPKDYLNLIEDIRIERLILAKYPGLQFAFKSGYKTLHFVRDFFGVKDAPLHTMNFMDRLNLKAKMRDTLEVPFTDEEKPYLNMALNVGDTLADVIRVAVELFKFMQKKQEERKQQQQGGEQHGDEQQGDEQQGGEQQGDEQQGDEQQDDEQQGDEQVDDDDDAVKSVVDGDANIEKVETDRAFRHNEQTLISFDQTIIEVEGLTLDQVKNTMITTTEIIGPCTDSYYEYNRNALNAFMVQNDAFIKGLVKEFNMRKAATVAKRTYQSKRGTLDLDRLHSYRTSDDIFLSTEHKMEGKNHGMFMLLDLSGSMRLIVKDVILQAISMIDFCRRVGIPYEVYGFNKNFYQHQTDSLVYSRREVDQISENGMSLVKLASSSDTKTPKDYKDNLIALYAFSNEPRHRCGGSTPLNEYLTAVPQMLKRFRAKHKLEKVVFNLITDGVSNGRISYRYNNENMFGIIIGIRVEGKIHRSYGFELTVDLLNAIRKMPGVEVIGSFLAQNLKDVKTSHSLYTKDYLKISEIKKLMKGTFFIQLDNVAGYDSVFLIDASNDNFAQSSATTMGNLKKGTKGEIRKVLGKHLMAKKQQRFFAAQIAKAVA